jgi:hypothetical protein
MKRRSMLCVANPARLLLLLGAIAVAVPSGAPEVALAGKRQPSPFAGCYLSADDFSAAWLITISDSGRITFEPTQGSRNDGASVSGCVWEDGLIEITWKIRLGGRPIGGGVLTSHAVGLAALDDFGNMPGVLEWDDGQVTGFFWPRCD